MPQAIENIGAGEGNRTLVISLEGCCSTIELHPRRSRLRAASGIPAVASDRGARLRLRRHRYRHRPEGISVRRAGRQAGARARSIPARSIARAAS